jgi:ankyrin repeat protein
MARNVDVSALRDVNGYTLCHHVIQCGIYANDLIRAAVCLGGADVNAAGRDGRTPLHWVAKHYCFELHLLLLLAQLGADVDQQDAKGKTALMLSRGWAEPHKVLLALNTNVTLTSVKGKTACHFAAKEGDRRKLATIVAEGGDLDQPDNSGETPRMIAIREKFLLPTAEEIDAWRKALIRGRLDLVRDRAFQICVGLQSFRLNALQLCEIMKHSFGALGTIIAFHHWWAIATAVKHFHRVKR